MFLNNETDYAIRIISCLAESGSIIDAASISEKTGVTQRFTLKILRNLVSAGHVLSLRGKKGGYILAKKPSELTLLEVVEDVYGPLSLNICKHGGEECSFPGGFCRYKDVFSDITTYIRCKLSHVTFEAGEKNK